MKFFDPEKSYLQEVTLNNGEILLALVGLMEIPRDIRLDGVEAGRPGCL